MATGQGPSGGVDARGGAASQSHGGPDSRRMFRRPRQHHGLRLVWTVLNGRVDGFAVGCVAPNWRAVGSRELGRAGRWA